MRHTEVEPAADDPTRRVYRNLSKGLRPLRPTAPLRPHRRAPCHPARRPRQFRNRRSVVSIDCPFFGLIRLKPDFFAQGGGRIERWSQFGDIVNKRLKFMGMPQVEWFG